jgi:hypothetical protein
MRSSVFFRYQSGKFARDRPAAAGLRPALLFALQFFLLTVAVLLALFFTTTVTRDPLPPDPGPPAIQTPATSDALILADIRNRWPWRLVPPEWVIKPEAGDARVPAELVWLRVEGRARLFVIVTGYLLCLGFLCRCHRRTTPAIASTGRPGREGHAAGIISP